MTKTMTLARARALATSARLSEQRKLVLLCSFEPVVLRTYLQAHLAQLFPGNTPEVVTFGFGNLRAGLQTTATELAALPVLLFLNWDDLHPGLSPRTRGKTSSTVIDEIDETALDLETTLSSWISARDQAPTYLVTPSRRWLPALNAQQPDSWSLAEARAIEMLDRCVVPLVRGGARWLRFEAQDSDTQQLPAGCPLSGRDSSALAELFVRVARPQMPGKKLLILDLDNTLWNGTLDEDAEVVCDTTEEGYPFRRFQEFLRSLAAEGALLALCSRNDRSLVAAKFGSMKMPLSLDDFAAAMIDHHDKAKDIEAIRIELQVAPGETVFIGDNAALLAAVASANPGVECVPTPADDDGWSQLFTLLRSRFTRWSLPREETLHTGALRFGATPANSRFGHLESLKLKIDIEEGGTRDVRIHDLLNTTNQFNLTGERISEDEWTALPEETVCYAASLCDRYGDFGPVCAVLGRQTIPGTLSIDNMALSGRAFGYGIEFALLDHLCGASVQRVVGRWTDTGTNAAALDFLHALHADISQDGFWSVDADIIRGTGAEFLMQSNAEVTARIAVA